MIEEEVRGLLNKAMFMISVRLQNELILTAPVDGSGLVNSIQVKPASDGMGLIISMLEQGKYVEFGTNPHIIRAKPGKMLHWHKTKGRTQHNHPHSKEMAKDAVFAKEVKHPGTRPNPFIRNAINNKLGIIIQEEVEKELTKKGNNL